MRNLAVVIAFLTLSSCAGRGLRSDIGGVVNVELVATDHICNTMELRNNSSTPVFYHAYMGRSAVIYEIKYRTPEGLWPRDRGIRCGTDIGEWELPPGASIDFCVREKGPAFKVGVHLWTQPIASERRDWEVWSKPIHSD